MTPHKIPRSAAVIGVLLLAAALGACDRRDDDRTTGQKVDAAIAKADEKVDAAKADADKAVADAKQATTEAVHAAAAAVNDTTITARGQVQPVDRRGAEARRSERRDPLWPRVAARHGARCRGARPCLAAGRGRAGRGGGGQPDHRGALSMDELRRSGPRIRAAIPTSPPPAPRRRCCASVRRRWMPRAA